MSRSKIVQGLYFLESELKKKGLCEDTSQLSKAIRAINSAKKDASWSYTIDGLPILILDPPRNSSPNIESLTIYLTVSISETAKNKKNSVVSNLISNCIFSILIQGKEKDMAKYSYAGWHLDNDARGKDCIHPQFHMTYGGTKLNEKINLRVGNILHLITPRLPHPPLDGILAIDFILKHFAKKSSHEYLTESRSYNSYIKESQERLWRPYYTAISKHWCPGCSISVLNENERVKYLPQLL